MESKIKAASKFVKNHYIINIMDDFYFNKIEKIQRIIIEQIFINIAYPLLKHALDNHNGKKTNKYLIKSTYLTKYMDENKIEKKYKAGDNYLCMVIVFQIFDTLYPSLNFKKYGIKNATFSTNKYKLIMHQISNIIQHYIIMNIKNEYAKPHIEPGVICL